MTYSRCPYEMELHRRQRELRWHPEGLGSPPTLGVIPLRHSPLLALPPMRIEVVEGRLDIDPTDVLIYRDDGERDLPALFPPERIQLDARFPSHKSTLIDREFGLSGRPDLIVRKADGSIFPVEVKSTHLFVGYHETHGRVFDTLQALAECRLVHSAFGIRPSRGYVLYLDSAGSGHREGWVAVPYGDVEERWLRTAFEQIRSDPIRAPVPTERNCAGCQPNGDGLCAFAAASYEHAAHHELSGLPAR